jgi:hypothetical protein
VIILAVATFAVIIILSCVVMAAVRMAGLCSREEGE